MQRKEVRRVEEPVGQGGMDRPLVGRLEGVDEGVD